MVKFVPAPPAMPQAGMLYPHVSGRGFISCYIAMSGQIAARIMAGRFDVGFVTGLMPVASFWDLVDTAR
jgi:hypothetical protein